MGTKSVVKIGLQISSNLFLLAAICLTLAAMFTSSWQIADFGKDQIYEHGLYRDCVKSTDQKSGIMNTGEYLCFYKFDKKYFDDQQTLKNIQLKDWQINAMYLLGTSCIAALLAMLCSMVIYRLKLFSLPSAVLCLLAAVLSLAGLITFLRWSNESENRLFQMKDVIVEQQYGHSLVIAASGCILYFVAAILSAAIAALVFIGKND